MRIKFRREWPALGGRNCTIAPPSLTYRKPRSSIAATMVDIDEEHMSKPVPDKAEVALEYPDKFYVGTFEHSSRFEAHLDGSGFALVLTRPGAEDVRKSVHLHISFGLLAGILRDLAGSVAAIPKDDIAHREQLAEALAELQKALGRN
jgi:VIT1/CCC1 family predicted Fe2+/Mn2+ transporter